MEIPRTTIWMCAICPTVRGGRLLFVFAELVHFTVRDYFLLHSKLSLKKKQKLSTNRRAVITIFRSISFFCPSCMESILQNHINNDFYDKVSTDRWACFPWSKSVSRKCSQTFFPQRGVNKMNLYWSLWENQTCAATNTEAFEEHERGRFSVDPENEDNQNQNPLYQPLFWLWSNTVMYFLVQWMSSVTVYYCTEIVPTRFYNDYSNEINLPV